MPEAARELRGPAARCALLLAAVLLLGGCDGVREKLAGLLAGAGQDGAPAAGGDVPEGWESIEGSASAKRLYYQFNDERGQVRFVERLDEVPEAVRANVGFVKLDVPPPLSPADARQARNTQIARRGGVRTVSATAGSGQPTVIVYYADWCPACRKAKAYLNRKGVPFQVRDVDNPAAKQELLRKTGRRSIPVIDVDGRILTGFSPQAIDALLGSA
ncbi:MAG: glutaredoxin domain-containing protein [Myxococcota bacterium]|nr:glutaredoxin domain-containing protein [Myxococcota bacterium]